MTTPYSFLREAEDDAKIEINYDALIDLTQKDFFIDDGDSFSIEEKNNVVFYCFDCKQLVDAIRLPSSSRKLKVQFSCIFCKGKHVFYGTKRGIEKYFHLK